MKKFELPEIEVQKMQVEEVVMGAFETSGLAPLN